MSKSNEKEFNETLQRMLKTPPKQHADEKKGNKPPPKKKKAVKRKTQNKGPG